MNSLECSLAAFRVKFGTDLLPITRSLKAPLIFKELQIFSAVFLSILFISIILFPFTEV